MPFVSVDNTRLYYRVEGRPESPALFLSHSIGADHGMWVQQAEALAPSFHIVRCDVRGHGASDVPPGEYSMERLGRDVLAVADALNIPKSALCGLSLGGGIAQWVATHAPERLTHLV